MSASTFDEVDVDYIMVDGICYVNGESLVSHLKMAVRTGAQEVLDMIAARQLTQEDYIIAQAGLSGMAGVGMWFEECVIEATQEKFREALDKEWPSL